MRSRWLKGVLTVLGAVILSTLGIFAADSLQGIDGGFNLAGVKNAGVCNEGSVPVRGDSGVLCVDVYEASPSENCPHTTPTNTLESEQNANATECFASSVKDREPWSYVSLPQAQRICARAGKRLPASGEWYQIALGTNADACTVNGTGVSKTGNESCVSGVGVYDTIGNVWEWVDENIQGSNFQGRSLPSEGYVTQVDANGIAIASSESADELYGKDYFWSKEEGVFGMIRGGFYGSGSDAGLYTVNASVLTNFASQGVGFRCVQDVL